MCLSETAPQHHVTCAAKLPLGVPPAREVLLADASHKCAQLEEELQVQDHRAAASHAGQIDNQTPVIPDTSRERRLEPIRRRVRRPAWNDAVAPGQLVKSPGAARLVVGGAGTQGDAACPSIGPRRLLLGALQCHMPLAQRAQPN